MITITYIIIIEEPIPISTKLLKIINNKKKVYLSHNFIDGFDVGIGI